jgi:BASS family bile acid:Na+ symporter
MMELLSRLGRNGTRVLFLAVFLGLLVPPLAALLRPFLPIVVALLLFTALLRIDWGQLLEAVRRPFLIGLLVIWMQIGSAIAALAVLSVTPLPQDLTAGIVLMACAPPILGAAAIALLLGLDGALLLVVALVSTLLTPITVPPLALMLLGLELDIGLAPFMLRLGLLVGLSFLAAGLIRKRVGPARLAAKGDALNGVIVLLMTLFAIGIMKGVGPLALAEPERVLLWTAAGLAANPLLQLAGTLIAWRLGLKKALSVGLASGNCNMGLLLAALPPGADPGVALFFAVAQLPMYTLPLLQKPLYTHWLKKLAG